MSLKMVPEYTLLYSLEDGSRGFSVELLWKVLYHVLQLVEILTVCGNRNKLGFFLIGGSQDCTQLRHGLSGRGRLIVGRVV